MARTKNLLVKSDLEGRWIVEDENSHTPLGSYRSEFEANGVVADIWCQENFEEVIVRRGPGSACYRWTLLAQDRCNRPEPGVRRERHENRPSCALV